MPSTIPISVISLPIVALLLSCGSSRETTETSNSKEQKASEATTLEAERGPSQTGPPPQPPDAKVASQDALRPRPVGPIPRSSKQLIVTLSADWSEASAVLYRFERDNDGLWLPAGKPFDTMLGRRGLGWGRGLHELPAADKGPIKVEGDGKSPAGVFAVDALFGYDEAFAGSTKLTYQQVDKTWRCVDDSKSRHYNRILTSKNVEVDWDESEDMRRRDELYRLVVAIDHNSIFKGTPVPDGGSCIFFHVWRRRGAPTIGCTAMPLAKMKLLASWLDPASAPVLVALPRAEYLKVQESWLLPQLK